jgi:C1A family cysteine protease
MKFTKLFSTLLLLSLTSTSFASDPTRDASVVASSSEEQNDPFVLFLQSQEDKNMLVEKLMTLRGEFMQWVETFEREYESLEEELKRMMIWAENHEYILTHNSKTPTPSYTLGHNDFSDLSNDEFQQRFRLGKYSPGVDVLRAAHQHNKEKAEAMRKIHGMTEAEESIHAEFRYLRKLSAEGSADTLFDDDKKNSTDPDDDTKGLPASVDWVEAGAVTPVKNQGKCGSCWAFSTTGSIEGASFIKHGELISLSEQNLIDCDTREKGCNGGMMQTAFVFDEGAKGICTETDYPYIAGIGSCRTDCNKTSSSIVTSYLDIDEKDKHGLLASIALQPTSIAMQANQMAFQLYSGGVLTSDDCGEYGKVDHGVLAVGYGTDEKTGKKYWKVKNSWGPEWGEGGYFRLDRTSDLPWGTCAVMVIMTAPVVA